MKKLFIFTAVLLLLVSCRYKDLCYDHSHSDDNLELVLELNLQLDVDLDVSDDPETHTKIDVPTYMKVNFYDPQSGALNGWNIVGSYGGSLQVAPGTYNMVVYSFGTEWTQIRGEGDINTLEAFTSDITMLKAHIISHFSEGKVEIPGPVIYTPDHLLVARQIVEIPPYTTERHVVTVTDTVSTILETYGFEVTNITGLEYVASAEAFVTNQARSYFFGRGEKNTEAATIFFPVNVDKEEGVLKTTFNTFGKLPGESLSYLHIVVTDTEGNIYTITEDITEQFNDPRHEIVIDDPIDIPKPESGDGGIAPTVEEWENVNQDVPIG